jgi:hypothetical protein
MSAVSTITGALTLSEQADLAGSVAAQSSVSGDLVEIGQEPISGSLTGTATLSGNLTETESLAASVAATATITGGMTESDRLTGSTSGTATVSGALSLKKALAHSIPYTGTYDFANDPNCVAFYNAETWDTYLDDQSGTGNHLQCTPAVNTADVKEGNGCMEIDSDTRSAGILYDDTDLPSGWPGKSGTTNRTISIAMWFKTHEIPEPLRYSTLLCKYGSWSLWVTGGNKIAWEPTAGNNLIWKRTTSTILANVWYHVGVTFNNADKSYRIRVYDSSISANWADVTGTTTGNMSISSADVKFGWGSNSVSTLYNYDGLIDDVAVFNDVLSAGEIDACRAGTHPYATDGNCVAHWGFNVANFLVEDKGGLPVYEITTPTISTTVFRMGTASIEFQGYDYEPAYRNDADLSSDFPYKAGTTNLEWGVALWVRFRTLVGEIALIGKNITASGGAVTLYVTSGTNHPALTVSYGASLEDVYEMTTKTLLTNTWYHIVATISAANNTYLLNIYDDVSQTETEISGALLHDPIVNALPLTLGGVQLLTATQGLDGWLDEVAIFNVALTTVTITEIRLQTQADILSTVAANLNEKHSLSAQVSAVSSLSASDLGTESNAVFAQAEAILTYPPPVPVPWNYNRDSFTPSVASEKDRADSDLDLAAWGDQLSKYTEEELIKIHRNLFNITTSLGTVVGSSLTPSRLIATTPEGTLIAVNLVDWIAGTANRVTVTDDADGSVTLSGPQDLATTSSPRFARVEVDDAATYIDRDGSGNMTFTDAVMGTKTMKQLGSPTYRYIKATGQAEGDLHLSDATNWAISKAMIQCVRVVTSSTDWDLYLLQNDNGYAANDATIPMLRIANAVSGNANIMLGIPYQDEDASSEVHLYWIDNSGANTATIMIQGFELL